VPLHGQARCCDGIAHWVFYSNHCIFIGFSMGLSVMGLGAKALPDMANVLSLGTFVAFRKLLLKDF